MLFSSVSTTYKVKYIINNNNYIIIIIILLLLTQSYLLFLLNIDGRIKAGRVLADTRPRIPRPPRKAE